MSATPSKTAAAAVSVASNAALIALKLVAGVLTGSVAILADAVNSAIDLLASVVAYFSVREADKPADLEHPYGHEKLENLAAAIEGMLILVGAGIVVYESVRRLASGAEVRNLALGIAIIALTVVVNFAVSAFLSRRAQQTGSPALEGDAAHLRTDAISSAGVLIGLGLVELTGAAWLDPVVALLVTLAIVGTGMRLLTRSGRVLVDEALPEHELTAIQEEIQGFGPRGVAGFHALRGRRAGARVYVDLHLQFRTGTSLEDAHDVAHQLQDAIRTRLGGADVLIHLEPEDRVRPGSEVRAG
ncbi:MAG TPA: cation diffusion facilitator family transporter [Solirubrobacteraceae bacterium]|nr:cation diffusion facilitator family transporter [Solirubrobacteraceae bacterium]